MGGRGGAVSYIASCVEHRTQLQSLRARPPPPLSISRLLFTECPSSNPLRLKWCTPSQPWNIVTRLGYTVHTCRGRGRG